MKTFPPSLTRKMCIQAFLFSKLKHPEGSYIRRINKTFIKNYSSIQECSNTIKTILFNYIDFLFKYLQSNHSLAQFI